MSRTISTFNQGTGVAALSLVIAGSGENAPKLLRLSGYMNGTAGTQYFIQFHRVASAASATNGDAPVRSEQVVGGAGYTFDYTQEPLDPAAMGNYGAGTNINELVANGPLTLIVSTTKETLTKATGGNTAEMVMEVDGVAGEPNLTQSTTASGQTQNPWNDSAGPKRLFYLEVTAPGSFTSSTTIDGVAYNFIQIYARDSAAGRICYEKKIAASQTLKLQFGGFSPIEAGATAYDGCYIAISTTRGSYAATVDSFAITSRYKT